MAEVEEGGLHKIQVVVPDGNYTIPYIKITSQTDGYETVLIQDHVVSCPGHPTPTPVPVFTPVPVRTPISPPPVSCNCILITMTPTGMGLGAIWSVLYTDCLGVAKSTSGTGMDAPRQVYVCSLNNISVIGQVSITHTVPVAPVPVTPTPTPAPVPVSPTPTPVPTPVGPPVPVAPTPTPVPVSTCLCRKGVIANNSPFYYTDCNGIYFSAGAEGGTEICFDSSLPNGNISNMGADPICACAPSPTPVASTSSDFFLISNTTGYFDSDDFDTKISALAPSCRVIRFCIRTDELEIVPGTYAMDRLSYRVSRAEAIYAAQGLPSPMFSVSVFGVRNIPNSTDNYLPSSDLVVFSNGVVSDGENRTQSVGSLSSVPYRNKITELSVKIAQWFSTNRPGKSYYMTYSMGTTEEFYNHLLVGSGGYYVANGDYSTSARNAFRAFLISEYGLTTPWGESSTTASLPVVEWNPDANEPWRVSMMLTGGQPSVPALKARSWAKFVNRAMYNIMMAFKNAVKEVNPDVKVIHFIADYYRDQSCGWLMNAPSIFEIVRDCDGLYHSDGDMGYDGDSGKKYSSFDSSIPTWGDKMYFNEMDYVDMHMGPPAGPDSRLPNEEVLLDVLRTTYRKGGTGVHFAMSGNQQQWAEVNRINLIVLAEIQAGTLTRQSRSNAASANANLYPNVIGGNTDFIRTKWVEIGGSNSSVVNITLVNNA